MNPQKIQRSLIEESSFLRLPGNRIDRFRFKKTHFRSHFIVYYNLYLKSIKKNEQNPPGNTRSIIHIGENHLIYLTSTVPKETITVLFKIEII